MESTKTINVKNSTLDFIQSMAIDTMLKASKDLDRINAGKFYKWENEFTVAQLDKYYLQKRHEAMELYDEIENLNK